MRLSVTWCLISVQNQFPSMVKQHVILDQNIIFYQNGKKIRKVYENCQYDQYQLQQIEQFRQYAQPLLDVSQVSSADILRYLYSFDFKHPEALEKLKIYLSWQNDPKIQRFDQKTLQLINTGFCYTYGRDQNLRPIIYFNVALIDMEKYCIEDYLSATNAVINLVIEKLYIKGKVQNYLFIIDTEDKNFTSLPLNIVKEMTMKLSYVYSMRMGRLLIINCNYWIKLMYSTVRPFLADVTKQKINLLSTSEVQEGKLKEYIDESELEEKYSGLRENLKQKWPPQIWRKQQWHNKKQKNEFEVSFYSQYYSQKSEILSVEDQQSEYYSCENNQQMFYRMDENMMINEGCCAVEQCRIY